MTSALLQQGFRFLCLITALAVTQLRADVVEIKGGSKLAGKITKIEEGIIELDTPYAGTVKIKQSEVLGFTTDQPVNIAFKSGNTVVGKVENVDNSLKIAMPDGNFSSTPDKVEAAWLPGTDSPEIRKMKAADHHWSYDLAADLAGKTGNSNAFGTGVAFNALLQTTQDKLKFYGAYAYQKQDGLVAADQAKGGVDYSVQYAPTWSWYVRAEVGRDQVKSLKFYNTDAAGFGHDFIKNDKQSLIGRLGLAYRYESYTAGTNISSPGLDVELLHSYIVPIGKILNQVTYLPAFNNFSNYLIHHESSLEMPLANSDFWKIRLGISNDYTSKPALGRKRLDTTYFSRILLTWK